MTTDITKLFDPYNRHARLYPALLTLFPLILTVYAWFPVLLTSSVTLTIVNLAITCGLLYMLADFSRTVGKKHEPRLLNNWGGWPTSLWLRHIDETLPPQTKSRYHAFLMKNVEGLSLPSKEDEDKDPMLALSAYDSGIAWLKEQCRGSKFPLVERENAQYGFRRNMRGLKAIGIFIAFLALLFSILEILYTIHFKNHGQSYITTLQSLSGFVWVAIFFSVVVLIMWPFVIRDAWVREAGDQYARALLSNCDSLNSSSNTA